MVIRIDRSAVRTIREAAKAAAVIRNTFGLEIDLCIVFTQAEVHAIEARLEDADLFRFLRDVVAAWDRSDPDKVITLLADCLGHVGIELQYDQGVGDIVRELSPATLGPEPASRPSC